MHYITFAVVNWIDVFTRKYYRDLFVDSLRFCQENKGLILNAWCVMSNHVHLIGSSATNDLSGLLRDLKKFTATKIIQAIGNHPEESRKDWMLPLFKNQGQSNSRNAEHQFWRQDNAPMQCYSPRFTVQKLTYIHNNPVEAGLVEKPEDYLYSSAKAYRNHTNNGLLQVEFL